MTKSELKYLFLIIIIFIAACIETDIYLPAFPDMMTWFSASESAIQGLLTWNFVGICIACPLYGPLSDALGRKKPLLFALVLFFIGSLFTICAQTLDHMLFGRILQGLGSGGCFTLGTAIIFDAFQKEKAIIATNHLTTIIPLIMAAAPMLGGFLNHTFGFRSNFFCITLFVLLSLFICLFFLKETHSVEKRIPFRVTSILKDFKTAFTSLAFWQITSAISVLFGGYIAFLSNSSVLFMVEFGMSRSLFPFVQAAILGGWVLGSLLLNRAIAHYGIPRIKRAGILTTCIGGLGVTCIALIAPRDPYIPTFFMSLYAFGANWIVGLYFPEGMEILPEIKGITSSLITSARILMAALAVEITSALYNATIYPLAAAIFISIVITLPTLYWYERRASQVMTSA